MSYKSKNGDVISRKDWEKLPNKEQSEFSPCGETPNKTLDGLELVDLEKAPAANNPPAPPANGDGSDDEDEE